MAEQVPFKIISLDEEVARKKEQAEIEDSATVWIEGPCACYVDGPTYSRLVTSVAILLLVSIAAFFAGVSTYSSEYGFYVTYASLSSIVVVGTGLSVLVCCYKKVSRPICPM
jgi:hypothetical protein